MAVSWNDASPRRPALRPFQPPDSSWIESACYESDLSWRWNRRGGTPAPEQLGRWLWDGIFAQFVAEAGEPLGLLQSYDADFRRGTAFISILPTRQGLRAAPQWADVVAEFLDYLFTAGLRKVYFQVLSSHLDLLDSLVPFELVHEGRYVEFETTPSGFEDLLVLSVGNSRRRSSADS